MPAPKRVNYSNGQLLTAADFKAEQDYHLGQRRRVQSGLLTPGVLGGGLILAIDGPNKARVAPGTAIDKFGRELVVDEPIIIDFGDANALKQFGLSTPLTSEHYLLLTLSYAEAASDPVAIGGNSVATRSSERPVLKITNLDSAFNANPTPGDGIAIRLGRLFYAAPSLTTQIDLRLREAALTNAGPNLPALNVAGEAAFAGGAKFAGETAFAGAAKFAGGVYSAGSIYVNASGSNPELLITCNSIAARLYTLRNGSIYPPIVLQEADGSGNVGIGTNTPAAKLHVKGLLKVDGNIAVSGGKAGYVVDHFVNRIGAPVELGDVVVIGADQPAFAHGLRDNIPVPEVDFASTAYDTRVCGIVCEVTGELVGAAPVAKPAKAAKVSKSKAAIKTGKLSMRDFSADELAASGVDSVASGQVGYMVTLGAFAHCKVDADIAPIQAGDLLTTSPTPGHAQKVLDRSQAIGAIIGKALGSLSKGRGRIAVLVSLH